jgi:hypothetical protein
MYVHIYIHIFTYALCTNIKVTEGGAKLALLKDTYIYICMYVHIYIHIFTYALCTNIKVTEGGAALAVLKDKSSPLKPYPPNPYTYPPNTFSYPPYPYPYPGD